MLSELIKDFVNGAVTESGVFTTDGLKKLKALLAETTELRVFVSKSRGLGHQASSINILKRLISFGFTGDILVVYEENVHDPTVNKLAVLLPGFDPKNPGKPFSVNGVALKFVELSAVKDLTPQQLAITGGYDEKVNLATKLNAGAFLQLQPFQWTTQSNFLWLQGSTTPIDLNASEELGTGSFVQRAYYLPQPKVSDIQWDLFFEIPNINTDMLHMVELLDGYLGAGTDKPINFLPVYGVGDLAYNGLPTLPATTPTILFNLLAGVAVAQEQGSAANARPTVIAVMTELKKESWKDFQELAAGTVEADGDYKKAMQWAVAHKLPERVKILTAIDAEKFEEEMQALESKEILVINLPKVPPALFDLLYSLGTLPFVFEGKGTANLALNLGKPYMHMAKSGVVVYPSTFLTYTYVDAMTRDLTAKVALLQKWIGGWPAKEVDTPGFQLGRFIANVTATTAHNAYASYFANTSAFYHAEQNDKLLMGLLYWLAKHPPATKVLATLAAGKGPLQDLYDKLVANNNGGALNLIPGALSTGTIVSYLGKVIGSQDLTVGSPANHVTIDFPDPFDKITVKGETSAFGGTKLSLQTVFTVAKDNNTITSDISLAVGTIQLPDVPWFALENTDITVNVPGDGRVTGTTELTCRFGDTPLSLTTQFPTVESQILIDGSFGDNPPSFSSLFQVLGGINIVSTLPAQLNVAANLSLEAFRFGYDYKEKKIAAFNVDLKTTKPWPLFGKLTLESMDIHVAVASPTESREVSWTANSSFGIGPGVIDVGVTYPNLSVTAQLAEDSKAIPVGDLLTFFLPKDVTLNLGANLAKFSMSVTPGAKDAPATYDVQAALDTESWNLTVNSFTFGITELSVLVNNDGGGATGTLAGTIALFKDDPNLEFALNLSASYLGKNKGWKFEGKQTGNPIKVKDILAKYVSSSWASGAVPSIDIDDLGFQIEAGGAGDSSSATAYSFNGTVKVWDTPLGSSFETTIKAEFGYNGGSKTLGPNLVRTNGADFPALEDEDLLVAEEDDEDEKKIGRYGEISADIRWQGIELTVFYNFDPDYQSYGIVWGILTGKIEDKTIEGKRCKVATLTFTKNVTLGSMIETMVSWITGVKFGLEAPFNVLNDVSLSGLALHYNFTTKNVTFSVKIGPIDLGIMRIDSIDVNYASGNKDPKQNGLMVSLTGSFPWNTGDKSNGDTGKLGPWDASQPGAAPAPPGGGNKYLDLRLLALGQHVTVPGLIDEKSLSGVIAKLENLSIPKPPDIPLGGDNQPVFDANSSWFVAFDFGILKVEKPAQGNGSEAHGATALPAPQGQQGQALVPAGARALATGDGADDKEQYFVSLAIVFNDPYLYGLRLGLDGPMAKVFAGLEFEVMYQQVSENVGKYSGVIALPSIMRKIQVGVASITLPKFGVEVYTNGDFQIDLGFPWKEDFSIAFAIELQAGPFPVTGAAGLYFGKLSSATTNKVPVTDKGWFNPVIVFGFGAQIGLGKSIEAGILKAGFSLTVFGIIEGVIARWLPYGTATPGGDKSELQDGYYFALTGTMGVQGHLYGSIDLAIISAELNVAISIYVRITFASYEPIPITAKASVDVSLTVKINLGLFSISIHLGFKADVEATFVLENPMKGPAPWAIDSEQRVSTRIHTLSAPARLTARGLRRVASRQGSRLFVAPGAARDYTPIWKNLQRGTVLDLQGWVVPVLTIAGDIASTPDQQKICYVVNFFLESEKPIQAHEGGVLAATTAAQVVDRRQVAHVALERARNLSARATGANKFEDLAVRVLQWVIAAGQSSPLGPEDVDNLVISDDSLAAALSYLSGSTTPTPIPGNEIEDFLNLQTKFTFNLKEDAIGEGDSAPVVFFPAAPGITLDVPAFAGSQKYQYSFGGYNSSSSGYLDALNKYFNQLKVQVQEEQKKEKLTASGFAADGGPSIATYIFGDYFAMIGRLTIQAMRDGLRNYKLVIADNAGKTVQQIVDDINTVGNLPADEAFTVGELFVANQTHALSLSARPAMIVAGMKWSAAGGKSFVGLAAEPVFGGSFDATALALANAANTTIIAPGVTIVSGQLSYTTQSNDSLVTIASWLEFADVRALLEGVPAILSDPKLLAPQSILQVPQFSHSIIAGDTLQKVAAQYGIDLDALASANAGIKDLFDARNDPNLNVPHLSQYRVGALIEEMKRTLALQHLSAMVSRYYLHGLRLPTSYDNEKLTPNADGLFVQKGGQYPADLGLYALTGQAFPLSADIPDPSKQNPGDPRFSFSLNRGNESWLSLGAAGSPSVTYTLTDNAKHGNSDYLRYQSVKSLALAVGGYLNAGSFHIGPLEVVAIKPARYPLSSEIPCQPAVPVVLPNQRVNPPTPRPALWTLPSDLINLPNGTRIHPTLKPVLARTDESKGTTVDEDVNNYGFGTLITFTVKKIPASGPGSLAQRTYEIIGAPESEITLLERLLNQLRDDVSSFDQVALFYHPSATGSQAKGWESDDAAASVMGITQTNLSTETRPPIAGSPEAVGHAANKYPNLIGTPNEFLRLLWEASITRQGGFYLTYTKGIGGDMKGLPDHAFNDRGEAELAAFALFTRGAADAGQTLTNYTNVVVTNEPFDLSHAALIVEAVPRAVTGRNFDPADTLASYASLYYSSPGILAQENSTVPFNAVDAKAESLKVTVVGGVYEVPPPSGEQPTRDNPGGDLALIAQHFNTSIDEIKRVNAAGDNLPDRLDPYTAINLPQVSVSAEGNSFDSLSKYYHAPIREIAAANRDVAGLFAAKSLNVTIGPLTVTPLIKQGVAGMTLQRIAPEVPSQPGGAWAEAFLQQNFSLLGYRVASNPQNSYFQQSNWGLPSGPINPNPTGDGDKIQAPRATSAQETWNFSFAVPYASIFANAQPHSSPYGGVGGILQFELAWIDIFGNRILSELDNPSPGAGAPLNKLPQITGYTDRLLGIGQWPAVAHAYQVTKNPSTGLPSLKIQLDFDASAYAAAAASASGKDEVAAESGKQKLQQAIAFYELIVQQLTDPAGVTIGVTTTITPEANWIIPDQSTADEQSLKAWAAAILAYLKALLAAPTTTPPIPPEYAFQVTLDSSKINTDQIFKLSVTLTLSRKPELVAGELSDTLGVTEAATLIAPLTGPLTSNLGDAQPRRSLSLFAADFTAAFPPGLGVSYRIATGSDRMVFTGGGKSPLWVVQLGSKGAGRPISYAITNPGDPTVFAPRPISNVLQSKASTSIIEYQTGAVISLDGPAQDRSFSSIDLDNWMRVTLAAIDELLTPKYVSPAEILRKQIRTVPPPAGGWKDALQELLDSKKALADKLRVVMIPVYEGENANDQQLKDIREAFYQRMLGTMGQFYSVQAGVQFEADVVAAITPQSSAERVPRIFGDIVQASKSNTSLSSPKLDLKFAGGSKPSSPYLSSLVSATATDAKKVELDLDYNAQFIEHQIGTLEGIEGYQASSWLSFVDIGANKPPAEDGENAPLRAKLGKFDVPIVLREFPDTPALVNQDMVSSLTSPCYQPLTAENQTVAPPKLLLSTTECPKPGTYNPLTNVTRWNYAFKYSMQVHYQQDEIHGKISFNVATPTGLRGTAKPKRDLFDNLAQFTQVFPKVSTDLNTFLVPIEVGESDPVKLQNAQFALESASAMINWIADSASALPDETRELSPSPAPGSVDPVTFTISEDAVEKENPDKQKVMALRVTVTLGSVPLRAGIPFVEIDGFTCERFGGDDEQKGIFFYRNKDNDEYLLASEAKNIPGRTFILPDMDILERQNAQTEIYLSRNADIVPNKTIAKPFIYQTPHVAFERPLYPTLFNDDPINLATIYAGLANETPAPVKRTLACQLGLFYEALFANAGTNDTTLQLGLYYEYAINKDIQKIHLPVYLMPPTRIAIRAGGSGTPLEDIITTQAAGWDAWFRSNAPETDEGTLLFDLTVMSDLTERPMPILKMTGLYLPVADLV